MKIGETLLILTFMDTFESVFQGGFTAIVPSEKNQNRTVENSQFA